MRISRHVFGAALAAWAVAILLVRSAAAEDAFFDIPLADLKITSGELPKPNRKFHFQAGWNAMVPDVTLDGEGEAYLDVPDQSFWNFQTLQNDFSQGHLFIRAPEKRDVAGRMGLPTDDMSGMNLVKFDVPATAAKKLAEEGFYLAKAHHYVELGQQRFPGGAWFRHQVQTADQKLEELDPQRHGNGTAIPSGWVVPPDPTDAYDLFSGGQAISENLQLDRQLQSSPDVGDRSIDIGTLTGITVDKIDWKPLLKDASPKLDPLAKLIPADQHVLFFPSFAAATKFADESSADDTLLWKMARPHSEDAGIRQRYEQQLGLSLSDVGRMVGQATVKSVALTGSDPYFPTGTDVAVLLETDHPDALATALAVQIGSYAGQHAGVLPESGEMSGVNYKFFRSPDRAICSYIAALNGAVVVTNSPKQLERLAQVGQKSESISSLDEYKFFRTRYPLGDKDETAFLFISDPTIRRWCSPQWRIASARRIYVASLLAELTATHAAELESQNAQPSKIHPDFAPADVGDLTLSGAGINSSIYGTLAWMTPIVEMPVDKISRSEADGYNQWRQGYENNWRWKFDPIALRIGVADSKLSGDLTVMPLVFGSEYRDFVNISRGTKIQPDAGDRHADLAHLIVALNTKSEQMRGWSNMASALSPQAHIDLLGWLGSSVAMYVDDSPVWKKLHDMQPEERQNFFDDGGWSQLPIALQAEVSSPLKLAGFLTGVRAVIEQTAPGMTQWESLTYKDQPYVRVKATERGRHSLGEAANVALYYAPTGDSLIVSLNEEVLKQALDRQAAREAAGTKSSNDKGGGTKAVDAKTPDAKAADPSLADLPWLGENVCFHVDRKMFEVLNNSGVGVLLDFDSLTDSALQMRAWGNIPILNEWKRLFPSEDPVKVHQRLWHTQLICPGGGQYVWNDEWKTMESTVYGHPGQSKQRPSMSAALAQFQSANFGLTFEEHGLRGRLELNRSPNHSK
ncbi:MAG TPA: hypothetical protein VFE46_08930 [Pirellulales bacterium]|jgi:hypothetical protein|nr:hypothetical protein [Pirellulales bacterium]